MMPAQDNAQRVAAIVLQSAQCWPYFATKMTAGIAAQYARAMQDIPAEAVEMALASLVRTSDYFPSVAAIRREAESIIRAMNGNIELTADEGWHEVMHALRAYPHRSHPLQPLTQAALAACGGLTKLANSEEAMLPAFQSQFRKAYQTEQKRQKDNERIRSVIAALPEARQDKLLR